MLFRRKSSVKRKVYVGFRTVVVIGAMLYFGGITEFIELFKPFKDVFAQIGRIPTPPSGTQP